jgi:hypothetical protein
MPSLHQHPDFGPSRLRSLWDIMKQLRLRHILKSAELGGMSSVQQQWHQTFPSKFDAFDATAYASWEDFFSTMEDICVELELTASLATVRKIRRVLATSNASHSGLRPLQVELQERLVDEMDSQFYWALNVSEAERFTNPRKGWAEIVERFLDCLTDVEEASRCLALSRYAAAIFHSVQVVEVGLIELGKLIGVTDPLSGWTATTNRLHSIIKKGHEARTPFERQHFAFLEQMHGTVEGLKNAWRNKSATLTANLLC